MRKLHLLCGLAALGAVAFAGAAAATPLGQPGAALPAAEPAVQPAAWQCFQFGNCVWRPDAYFQPYGYYGHYRNPPPPPPYYRKRYYR